jgi:hypothetical protein
MRQTLRSALPIVAAALGRKFGVAVRVGGADGAKTDGGVIVLPDLPDSDPTLRAVTWGYLAHEAAHVRHTDFAAYARGAADERASQQGTQTSTYVGAPIPYPIRWIKRHLGLKHFLGTSENAVKTQVWCAVATYVLIAIVKKEVQLDASLHTFLQILSVSVFAKIPPFFALRVDTAQIEQTASASQWFLFES